MSITHHVLPQTIVAFRDRFPDIFIHVREGVGGQVLEDVRSGTADFGIGNASGLSDAFVGEFLAEEPCFVVLPRRHRLAEQKEVSLADLAGEALVSMPTNSGLRRMIDMAADACHVVLTHAITTNQFGTLFDLVNGGIGVSIVPSAALSDTRDRIAIRPLA